MDRPPGGAGSGYVVDTLHSARLACQAPDYERVVKSAIALGNDTDTTAAVAGGIAGLRHGLSGTPGRFRTSLRGSDLLRTTVGRAPGEAVGLRGVVVRRTLRRTAGRSGCVTWRPVAQASVRRATLRLTCYQSMGEEGGSDE
ncbi:MAG: ADP-ribosylglycohydrolase family protein [Myxococcales bacterium]|nr:ADP-ribosylglycohydrolase family protein [Myxococcales bacterium]